MRGIYILVIILLMVFGVVRESHALRCGNKLIRAGDTMSKVLKNCGIPHSQRSDVFGSNQVFYYTMNGREQAVRFVEGIVRGGV